MDAEEQRFRLRMSEWVLLYYFGYVTLIAVFFQDRPHLHYQPLFEFLVAASTYGLLSLANRLRQAKRTVGYLRDWLPNIFILAAFWEMELFLPHSYPHIYEWTWQHQDHVLLTDWHLRSTIEGFGPVIPLYSEACYLLVYAVGVVCVAVIYRMNRRSIIDRFLTVYLIGTLAAYSLFPYFPSQPPRVLFPGIDDPHVITWIRRVNLAILAKGTIHVGVFPSAHVSAAFSAAWGFFSTIPTQKIFSWILLAFACSVSIATIYGRYHYTADVISGLAVSFSGVLFLRFTERLKGGLLRF